MAYEWRPIETAPTERQKILVWDERAGPEPTFHAWQCDPSGPHPSTIPGITHWMPYPQKPESK